jgi:hypothetical protein
MQRRHEGILSRSPRWRELSTEDRGLSGKP